MALKTGTKMICEYCRADGTVFMGYRDHSPVFSISREDTFGIYRCKNCGLFFISPKPTSEELKTFFRTEYHNVRYINSLKKVLSGYPHIEEWKWPVKRIKRYASGFFSKAIQVETCVKKYLNKFSKGRPTILEIGPGTSPLLSFGYMGYNYIGVEPCKDIVSAFNDKGYRNMREGFGEDIDFIENEAVDAIIFIRTLSHVSELRNVIKECHRVLKKKGIIFIIDCNADNNALNNIKGSYTNYGFPRAFLAGSIFGFDLLDYRYIDQQRKIDPNGSKMAAVLRKA